MIASKKLKATLPMVLALWLGAASAVMATPITGVTSTGTGTVGAKDTNFSVTEPSSTVITPTDVGTNPIPGQWFNNSANGNGWDSITSNASANQAPGTYLWTQTFTIDTPALVSATITGTFTADNNVSVTLNGHLGGSTPNAGSTAAVSDFKALSSFSFATNDFLVGTNTLVYTVTNQAGSTGPTGLLVNITAASFVGAPEVNTSSATAPTAFVLLGGLLLMDRRVRHRQQGSPFLAG